MGGSQQSKEKPDSKKKVLDENKTITGDEVLFSSSDNRTKVRIYVEFEVTLTGPHSFFTSFTMDISEGGVFVATHQIFPIGTEFRLKLIIGEESLDIDSKVIWVRGIDGAKVSGQEPGMGLSFINLDDHSLAVISTFIKKREPLFYDSQL